MGFWCFIYMYNTVLNTLNTQLQNSTPIFKVLSKTLHSNIVSNKALTITPIGKFFLIISNIIYLPLVRFKIGFVCLYFSSRVHLPRRGCTTLKLSAIFRSCCKSCRNNVFHFSVVCASSMFLSCCWWWGGRWAIWLRRRLSFVVVVVHSSRLHKF